MLTTVFACSTGLFATILVAAHIRAMPRLIAASKTLASLCFVLVAISRTTTGSHFDAWMLGALCLCAVGDVLLIGKRTFDPGLGAFLVGHAGFAIAFAQAEPAGEWPVALLLPQIILAAVVTRWLWPHLGRRKIPVLAYMAAIAIMVWGALSASLAEALSWTTAIGAVLFMLSDITVARERFVRAHLANKVIGLPMYYAGLLLLAFTVGR